MSRNTFKRTLFCILNKNNVVRCGLLFVNKLRVRKRKDNEMATQKTHTYISYLYSLNMWGFVTNN